MKRIIYVSSIYDRKDYLHASTNPVVISNNKVLHIVRKVYTNFFIKKKKKSLRIQLAILGLVARYRTCDCPCHK